MIGYNIFAQVKPVAISSYLHYQVIVLFKLYKVCFYRQFKVESCVVSPTEDTSTMNIELIKEAECSLERDCILNQPIRVLLG